MDLLYFAKLNAGWKDGEEPWWESIWSWCWRIILNTLKYDDAVTMKNTIANKTPALRAICLVVVELS